MGFDKECRLCESEKTTLFHTSENREYHHCKECDLVYVPTKFYIPKDEEFKKYQNHQNSLQDQGYCDFLNRLLDPLSHYLQEGANGLDFGSGPGPTLSKLMEQRGFRMDIYDIFFADNKEVFEKRYDFITSTEVIEHLHHPLQEIERLWGMLGKGGVLGLMTAFRVEDFKSWYYKRDLTHINFFSPKTFEWLAEYLGGELVIPSDGVVVLVKD